MKGKFIADFIKNEKRKHTEGQKLWEQRIRYWKWMSYKEEDHFRESI